MGNSGADRLELPPAETNLSTKAGPGRPRSKSRESSAKSAALVDEVFVRHHVERLIERIEKETKKKKSIFAGLVNHPLLASLIPTIPLVLTGLTLVNDSTTRLIKEVTEQKSYYNQNVSSLSRDLLSRTERGVLLRYALLGKLGTCNAAGLTKEYKAACERQIQDLIYERKKNYDAAYLSWVANYPDYLFNIAQIFDIGHIMEPEKPQVYPQLKSIISNLTASTLRRMDSCLSLLYGSYQRTGRLPVDESKEADCAGFDIDKNSVRNCGVVLAEQLHSMVTVIFNRLDKTPQYGSKEAKTVNRATVLASSIKLQTGHYQSNSSNQFGENKDLLGEISSACQFQSTPDAMVRADAEP